MKRFALFLLILGVGVLIGHSLNQHSPNAQAVNVPGCADANNDGIVDVSDASYILNWLFLGGPEPECPDSMPQDGTQLLCTNQTRCFSDFGVLIPCENNQFPGQDGYYVKGYRLDPRFVDNEDGTVTDLCTGLMWQRETANTDLEKFITEDDKVTWRAALLYCEELEYAGHDDWRVPNIRELRSLVDYDLNNPSIDPIFSVVPEYYWSSTTIVGVNNDNAWITEFYWGILNYSTTVGTKTNLHYVRAVREAN